MHFKSIFVPRGKKIKNERTQGIRWIHYFPIIGMERETIKLHKILFFVTKTT